MIAAVVGGLVAWMAFRKGREIVTAPSVRTVFAHKFYFDELYDALFSRPAQLVANRLRERRRGAGRAGLARRDRRRRRARSPAGRRRLQSGLLRSYALVVAASVAVLVVVFVAVR